MRGGIGIGIGRGHGKGRPAASGPAILFAEDFATDPAARWDEAVGTYLPTGGADGGGAWDLSSDDPGDTLPDGTLVKALAFGNTANAANATGVWSAAIRLKVADLAASDYARIILTNDQGNWSASVQITMSGAGQTNLDIGGDSRDGNYTGGVEEPGTSPDVDATLNDGAFHWLELTYEDTEAAAVRRVYLDGALQVTSTDDTTPRAVGWFPTGVQIDGPSTTGTVVVDRVSLADGLQGI